MGTTYFDTVDGEIIGESSGSTTINYATDALGSVTGTLVGGQLQNTYVYKPYGALLAKTGTGSDPKHGWNGSSGYRPTGRAQSDYYVRARHYGSLPGRWTNVDSLWPTQPACEYAWANPTSNADPSGAKVVSTFKEYCGNDPCERFNRWATDSLKNGEYAKLLACMKKAGFGSPHDINLIHKALAFIQYSCLSTSKNNICAYWEGTKGHGTTPWPPECGKPCAEGSPKAAAAIDATGSVSYDPPEGESMCPYRPDDDCSRALRDAGCTCVILICNEAEGGDKQWFCDAGFYHEMTHCAGFEGSRHHNDPGGDPNDFVYRLGCCLCMRINPGGNCGIC